MTATDETRAQVRRWLDGTTYKPGWIFELQEHDGVLRLHAVMPVEDSRRPGRKTVVTGIVELAPDSVADQFAFRRRVLALVEHLELHEVREWLLFDGDRAFDPHATGAGSHPPG